MKTTDKLTKAEFELALKRFTGTTQYWQHKFPGSKTLRLTDDCRFVREEAEARWLFNAIASLQSDQSIQLHPFQMWQLKRWEGRWVLECRCDDGDTVLTQRSNKEFPLHNFEVWVVDNIALLPSEY